MKTPVIKQWCMALLLLCTAIPAMAQVWPTQVNTIIVPPYVRTLSNYVNTPNKLIVNLMLRDFSATNVKVKLKMTITGLTTGYKATTSAAANTPVITLDGGVPLRLSDAELAAYFKPENLIISGTTAGANGLLPEDNYTFCFDVYEYYTNAKLSVASGCANAWVSLGYPPTLFTPLNESKVQSTDPTVINFQWTPSTNSINTAFAATEYELTIKEVPVTVPAMSKSDFNSVFLTLPAFYTTTLPSTIYVYGLQGEPLMNIDYRYLWQVRAIGKSQTEDLGLYINDGKSDVFGFTYANNCPAIDAKSITITKKSISASMLTWKANGLNTTHYTVYYREWKEVETEMGEWMTKGTDTLGVTLTNLSPNTVYQYYVANECPLGGVNETKKDTLRTMKAVEVNCDTIVPRPNLVNSTELEALRVNDIIHAGDFEVTVTKITKHAEHKFTGEGYATIPYLQYSQLKVTFKDIKINTAYQLMSGQMVTSLDETWSAADSTYLFNAGGNTEAEVGTGVTPVEKDKKPDEKKDSTDGKKETTTTEEKKTTFLFDNRRHRGGQTDSTLPVFALVSDHRRLNPSKY